MDHRVVCEEREDGLDDAQVDVVAQVQYVVKRLDDPGDECLRVWTCQHVCATTGTLSYHWEGAELDHTLDNGERRHDQLGVLALEAGQERRKHLVLALEL